MMPENSYKSEPRFVPDALLSRLMGDQDLMRLVLDACLPSLRTQLVQFHQQLDEASSEAERTIHSMKGSALNSAFTALAQLALEIEDGLKKGDFDSARSLLPELSQLVEETISAVEVYFASCG